MKKFVQFFLIVLAASSIALSGNKRIKDEVDLKPILLNSAQPEYADAASSPWTPINLESGTSQYKVLDYFKNGVIVIAGARTTAPLLGNYYGYYSKDNGSNFTKFSFPNFQSSATSTSMRFVNIASHGDSVMINADYSGYLIRSHNWGATWDTIHTSYEGGGFYDGIKFISRDTVVAYGDAVDSTIFITRSTDRGLTWNRIAISSKLTANFANYTAASASPKSIGFFGNTILMGCYIGSGSNAPGVLKSTDAGLTWSFYEITSLAAKQKYSFSNFSFKDANVAYGLVTNNYTLSMHKTTDGGATWSDTIRITGVTNVLNQQFSQVQAIAGTSTVFASGFDGVQGASWTSTDDGATWTKLVTPINTGAVASLSQISFTSASIGFGAGTRQVLSYTPAVKVTFLANTAGIPDTLKTTSYIQIRGGAANLTWDNLSPAKMTNVGTALNPSDYWTYTGYFPVGATFDYKFFTNAKSAITGSDNGWDAGNNRSFTVGNNDTTIAVQYANGFDNNAPQFGAPFPTGKSDTVVAYIRVNMKSFEPWDATKHKVGIRGNFAVSNWGTTIIMKQENPHANGGQGNYSDPDKFCNVPIYWKKSFLDTASAADRQMVFKFVVHNINAPVTEDWSLMVSNMDINQYSFTMPNKDTTIFWKWYGGVAYVPPQGKDTITVKYRVDLSTAQAQKGFKAGDTVIVKSGLSLTAANVYIDTLKKVGLTGSIYESPTRTIPGVASGATLNYQYYSIYNLTEIRETFYDFDYKGTDTKAEQRKWLITAKNLTVTVADTSVFTDNMRRRPTFQSKAKLARNVNVTFTCDLRPAYYQLLNNDSIFAIQSSYKDLGYPDRDSVYIWGVWINGPAVGGWGNTNGDWGLGLRENVAKKMWDDGTHGDVTAGDRIYSLLVPFYKDSANNTVGQVFKFGLGGGDNEGGKGGFGNNHVRNIDDAAATATISEDFGSMNPKFYKWWNFTNHTTGVDRLGDVVPVVYELSQNYPNPFNPTTTINYAIPTDGVVSLKIYNILGQQVVTLVNKVQVAGKYQATFNASTLSSGVYFYKIESGKFSSVKKMMLLK